MSRFIDPDPGLDPLTADPGVEGLAARDLWPLGAEEEGADEGKENPLLVLDVADAREDDETRDGAGLPCLRINSQLR